MSFKVNGYRETIELKCNLNFESFQNFWNVLNVTPVILHSRFTPPLPPPPATPRTNFFITLELLKLWSWNFDSIKSNSLERFLGWNQTPLQLLRICKWLILRLTFLDIDMIRFWNFPKYISLKRRLLASFLSLSMSAKISFWFVNYTLVTRPKY